MSSKSRQHLLEAIGFVTVTVACIHMLPAEHEVHQVFNVSGNTGEATEVSSNVEKALRSLLETSSLKCRRVDPGNNVLCQARVLRRGKARALQTDFRERAPSEIGFIPRTELERRLGETESQLTVWGEQSVALEKELDELVAGSPQAEKNLLAGQQAVETLEKERSQLEKQQSLIDDTLQKNPSNPSRPIYEKKQAELATKLEGLKAQLQNLDAVMAERQGPIQRRKEIEEALPRLRAQIDLARARVSAWKALKKSDPDQTRLPDPDGFQITPQGKGALLSVRTWEHLPWSFLIGLLLFALFRGKAFSHPRGRSFLLPQEVEERLGLRFLGYFRQSP